ncbi:MAG TPA: PqqD family protein [Thermoanaerobaculia bacterium]
MEGTRRLVRSPGIEEAPLDTDLMLFDPGTSKFYMLNRTMAFVWRACDGKKSASTILESMRSEFDGVDTANASTDLGAALDELMSLGLIRDAQ